MPKITKNIVDADLRRNVFYFMFPEHFDTAQVDTAAEKVLRLEKINDRQFGVIMTDLNGVERYVRIGAIVAEEREDMTARELMQREIDDYNRKQAEKAEKAKTKQKKEEEAE
jgi:hypothetical protein